MCVYSMVMEYFDPSGDRRNPPPAPPTPIPWTRPVFDDFKEILRRIEDLDRKLGQPDCSDPNKAEVLKRIEDRLKALEEKVGT